MSLALLQDCLLDVGDCMRSSKLNLNPDKTEVLLFGTNSHRKEFMKHFPAKLLDQDITPTDSARHLGVVLDGGLNFRKHIYQWFAVLATITFVTYVACVCV